MGDFHACGATERLGLRLVDTADPTVGQLVGDEPVQQVRSRALGAQPQPSVLAQEVEPLVVQRGRQRLGSLQAHGTAWERHAGMPPALLGRDRQVLIVDVHGRGRSFSVGLGSDDGRGLSDQ